MEKLAFGGVIKEEDKRNYSLEEVNQALGGSFMSAKSNNDYSSITVDYQGHQPACGLHAGAMFKNIQSLRAGLKNKHASPRFGWKYCKLIDSYPISSGTDINSIFKVMRSKGLCRFELTGNDVTLSLEEYAGLITTPEMDTDGATNETEAEAFIYQPTWSQICQTIDLHGACVLLMRVGENMYNPSWKEADILPLSPNKFPMDGGHFVCAINYDEKYIYFRNSWGDKWGRNGDGYFGKEYMPYVNSIAVAVNKKDVPPIAIPAFQFTKDLNLGMKDSEVKELQKFLNTHGFPVATTGVGSSGQETNYFGVLTQAALAKFQADKGITPSVGYFGIKTRTIINALIK